MFKTKMEVAVVVIVLILLGSLLTVAVSRAKTAAMKMASQNNLKQLGLALQNHEDAFKSLPPGCDIEAKHGWMSTIFPFMEQNSWYSTVDFDLSWDHPLNSHQFRFAMQSYCNPGQPSKFTKEGFGVTGYHANPALLHRGSKVRISDLTAGISNIWLAGEIKGNITPFGYPFNWRELNEAINQGPDSFGGWSDGAHFIFLDGAVKFIESGIDPAVLENVANAPPLPSKEFYERPDRRFEFGAKPKLSKREYFAGKKEFTKGGPPYSEVFFSQTGSPEYIDFVHGQVEAENLIQQSPQAKVLRIAFPENANELEQICKLKELETLCLLQDSSKQIEASELILGLQQLPKLKVLKLPFGQTAIEQIRVALANCEVIVSSNHAPAFHR